MQKDVSNLKSVSKNNTYADYIFTYTNSNNETLDLFRDRVEITKESYKVIVNFKDIKGTNQVVNSTLDCSDCKLVIETTTDNIEFNIDTASRFPYFDIFPIHRSIERAIAQHRYITK